MSPFGGAITTSLFTPPPLSCSAHHRSLSSIRQTLICSSSSSSPSPLQCQGRPPSRIGKQRRGLAQERGSGGEKRPLFRCRLSNAPWEQDGVSINGGRRRRRRRLLFCLRTNKTPLSCVIWARSELAERGGNCGNGCEAKFAGWGKNKHREIL